MNIMINRQFVTHCQIIKSYKSLLYHLILTFNDLLKLYENTIFFRTFAAHLG